MNEFNISEFEAKSEKKENAGKKQSKFVKIMKNIFVHNIGYKILALALSVALWILLLI